MKSKNKSNKIEHTKHLEECAEYILENKSGWTDFTNWAREKYDINNKQANQLWKDTWAIISEDFSDNIKQSVHETLVNLERLEQVAISENDRRVWLEIIKYRNKIRGGEVERQEIKVQGNVTLSWGNTFNPETDVNEML
jgi:hypothetical protein